MAGFACSIVIAMRAVNIMLLMAQALYKNVLVTSWMNFVCFWLSCVAVSSGFANIFSVHSSGHMGVSLMLRFMHGQMDIPVFVVPLEGEYNIFPPSLS